MHLKKEFQLCTIAGRDFLIPVGTAVVDVQSMLDLNEVSSFIVRLLEKGNYSEDELVERIYDEYEADKNQIRNDLRVFLTKGRQIGFLEQ